MHVSFQGSIPFSFHSWRYDTISSPFFHPLLPHRSMVPFPQLRHNLHEAGAKRGLVEGWDGENTPMVGCSWDLSLKSYFFLKNCRGKNNVQHLTISDIFLLVVVYTHLFNFKRAKRDKHIIIILQHLPNWLYTSRKLPCFQKSASFNWDIWKPPTSMVNGKLHHIPKRACAQVHCKAKWPT